MESQNTSMKHLTGCNWQSLFIMTLIVIMQPYFKIGYLHAN